MSISKSIKEELKMIKDAEEYSYPFYIKPGSQYEYKLVDEAKLLVYTGGIDALALLSYQASRINFKKRTLRDRFFAGLAYSEFLAIDSSDDNALYAASIQRGTYCKRINIDGFELFKKVERMYDCTRYPE